MDSHLLDAGPRGALALSALMAGMTFAGCGGAHYVGASLAPVGWLGRTGAGGGGAAGLAVDNLGRELVVDSAHVRVTLARIPYRDSDSGLTASGTRLDLSSEGTLPGLDSVPGLGVLGLDFDGTDRDMIAVGPFWRTYLTIVLWEDWTIVLRGDVHVWVGGDENGIQAACAGGLVVTMGASF